MPRLPDVCSHVFTTLFQFSNGLRGQLNVLPLRRLSPTVSRRFFFRHNKHPFFRLLFTATCLLILLITYHASLIPTYGQSATATLSGTVSDQNGAVVPNVSVVVVNLSQGFQRSTTTNNDGVFIVPLLPPATYTVKVEHQGFMPAEVRDVVLNVNDQVRLPITLKVGGVDQTVDIVDTPSLIDESPAVGTVVDRQFVANLPLNGRSFQSLITLTPGTVLTTTTAQEAGQFSVNGQRADANYFSVDGVSANIATTFQTGTAYSQSSAGSLPGLAATGGTTSLVSVDALQEFKVQTSTYAPEFGRTPGGQISIVTRSGTNDFHGSVFEYFRNDALDANNWFANSLGRKKAALRQNIFGGVIGGPVLLPRFGEGGRQPWFNGRDKTFFFFSYEGHRLRLPKFAITDVPSLSARQDPAASPIIRQLLRAYPLPTGPERANRFAEFASTYSDPSSVDATSVRIDHAANSKLSLFGRYNYSPSESETRLGTGFNSLNNINSITNKIHTLTLGITSAPQAGMSNEFRVNWSRVSGTSVFSLDGFGGAVVPLRSFFILPEFDTPTALSTINLIGSTSAQLRLGALAANRQRQFNVVDNVSLTRDSHQLKFGIDYRRLSPVLGANDYHSFINFFGVTGALTGRTFNALILAIARNLQPVFNNFSVYGQDTWKITNRLTLTYGMRWELNPPPHEKNGNHPAVLNSLDNPPTMSLAPFGTPLYNTTYNNFAPRLGVAYQLSQQPGRETVLRGGFGIFYDLGNVTAGGAFGNVFPFTSQKRLLGAAAPFFPLTPAQAAPASFSLVPSAASSTVIVFDPNLKLPRSYQWNVAVEQSLGSNQTVSASYIAAIGRRLLRQENLAGAALNNPNFAIVTVTRNTATSDYHALQLQLDRHLSRGLQVLASYTWSHSIDIASRDSATLETFPIAGANPQIDRGSSDFDVRHAFRLGATYNLPAPAVGAIGKAVLSNWSVDAIYVAQSATPVDIIFQSFTPQFSTILARPDLIQGVPLYLDDPTLPGGRRINPAAFSIPSQTNPRQGSLGRNSLRGFSISQVDFVARRQLRLSEGVNIQFKAEFFNLLNHPNFANPFPFLGFPDFGRSIQMYGTSLGSGGSAGGLNPLYQVGGPRSIQFSLRLGF